MFYGLKLLFIVWVLEVDFGLFKNWEYICVCKNSNNNFELILFCNDCYVFVNIWSFNNYFLKDIFMVKVKWFCLNFFLVFCFLYGYEVLLGGL